MILNKIGIYASYTDIYHKNRLSWYNIIEKLHVFVITSKISRNFEYTIHFTNDTNMNSIWWITFRTILKSTKNYIHCFEKSSLKFLRSIFPEAVLGIDSTNLIPPESRLYSTTCWFTNSWISCSLRLDPDFFTMKANGNSPLLSSVIPMTPTSKMSGCEFNRSSSSAGGT